MIIQYYNDVPTESELQTRVYELEQALLSVSVSLIGARNSVDRPREHISPTVIKLQIDQALRTIKNVI